MGVLFGGWFLGMYFLNEEKNEERESILFVVPCVLF